MRQASPGQYKLFSELKNNVYQQNKSMVWIIMMDLENALLQAVVSI